MKPISFRPRRLTKPTDATAKTDRKARAGLAAVVAGCVALMSVVVLSGPGNADSGVAFTQSGHWVYNSAIGRIFHLNGSTGDVDAEVGLSSGIPGAQVVQTDKNGYVLSRSRIDQFGKSDLTVADEPIEVPVDEQPVGLEAAGAAFAVYQKSGRVMRLGSKEAVAVPGGRLGDPVVTSDGTLWVHRVDQGDLCQLPLAADRMSCPASVPKGHKGSLTAIGTKAVFVDLTARDVYTLTGDGIGERTELRDVEVPDNALVAGNDLDGRLAIVDPGKSVVHLVELGARPAAPITTRIRPGKYDKVASSGQGLALLDRKNADLLTLGRDGKETSHQKVASRQKDDEQKREPNLFRGDDSRVYVESSKGDRVVVVDRDGEAETVELGSDDPGKGEATVKPTQKPTQKPTKAPPPIKTPPPPVQTRTPPARKTTPSGSERPTPGKTRTTPPRKTTPPKSTPTNQATAQAGRPGAPVGVQARAGDGYATVNWQAATANGAPITSYKLSWSGGSTTVAGTARSATITGLADTTGYYITVQAVNRVGTGPAVRSNRLSLKWIVAESPRELLVKADDVLGTLVMGWDEPEMKDGTFLHYAVTMGSQTKTTTALQSSWSGLTKGKSYTFTVRAITRAPDGQTLVGWPATLTATAAVTPGRTKRVVASRGAGAEYEKCDPPACAFVQVRIENLRPNTNYVVKPWTSKWGNFNSGATLRTSSEGHLLVDDRFPCSAVGQTVWATVTGPEGTYTSNKFVWKSP